MEDESPKAVLYAGFARVGRALGSPARIELLNLLAQGERGVEELAAAAGLKVSNTSAQLKALAAAGLVTSRRSGTRVFYRITGPRVTALAELAKQVACEQLPEVRDAARAWLGGTGDLEPVTRGELRRRMREGGVLAQFGGVTLAFAALASTSPAPSASRRATWPPGWPSCPPAPRLSRTAAAGTA